MFHVLRREAEAMMFPNLPAFLAGTYLPGRSVRAGRISGCRGVERSDMRFCAAICRRLRH